MKKFPIAVRTSLLITLFALTLPHLAACGSGVTIEGEDNWPDDTNIEHDTDLPDTSQTNDATPDNTQHDAANHPQEDVADTPPDDATTDTDPTVNPFENLPAIYPFDRTHSPITPYVAQHLRSIAELDPDLNNNVFSKIGDSLTVNTGFMHCFSASPDLSAYPQLQPATDYFLSGSAGSTNPYIRESLAAGVGWRASKVLDSPNMLDAELAATDARYALIMYGTNDIGGDGTGNIYTFGASMLSIADKTIANATIPVFTSIPWRANNHEAERAVPRFNAVIRAIAQARQVPFIDLSQTWAAQPGKGLLADGIHLNSFQQGCNFNETGLTYGHNARNLATIQQLARLHDLIDNDTPAPDNAQEPLHGDGSSSDPITIPALPFVDSRHTGTGGQSIINAYPGCNATQNESGNEFIYKFHTDRPIRVRAFVIVRSPTDVDVHLLDHTATGQGCIARHDKEVIHDLQPGTYHFALDTFVSSNGAINSGEYLFVLLEEPQ